MKLYLVWSSVYEEADIEAIFDNLEEAKQFVYKNWRKFEFMVFVEEHPLGTPSYSKTLYRAEILDYYEDEKELKVEQDWANEG